MPLTRWVRAIAAVSLATSCTITDEPYPEEPTEPGEPEPDPDPEPVPRGGVDGSNCAGAAAVMTANGVALPFQSVVAYYYQIIDGVWTAGPDEDSEDVLAIYMPPWLENSEAFYE